MKKGLITVVVPVYNVEKYLNRCIQSIVNQTYKNLEIILVDDGSPDHCPQMCDEWATKDNRIKVIHKINAGLGMARNTGIENSTGEYICFFDSDDYVDLTTIEKARNQALAENAEVVLFGMANVDEDGNVTKKYIPETKTATFLGEDVQNVLLPDLIENGRVGMTVKNLVCSAWSCLFSTNLIERNHWRFLSERQCISEDSFALICLYRYVTRATILSEALYFYCANESSLTRVYKEDRYDRIKQFYFDTIELAEEQRYGEKIKQRIAGLFLSFAVAAMKQICAANMKSSEKRERIRNIVADSTMQEALNVIECNYESRARNILIWTIRKELHLLVYLLVCAQNKKAR